MKRFLWLALLFVPLIACAPTAETAVTPQPSPETAALATETMPPPVVTSATAVAVATQPVTESPTPSAETEPTTAVEADADEGDVISGRTEEGAFFLGDPNAPITHIDYSDFL